MSNRYKGGVISATPPTTTGGEDGTASGAWTLEQQMQLQAAGLWPAQPTGPYIEQVFSTYLYTGNGSTQTITNGIDLAGEGGMVWLKGRDVVSNNTLADTTRGTGSYIYSNSTSAADTGVTSFITAFNTTGFSLGSGSGVNQSSKTWTSWTFRKQPKFFDVVTWTGNGASNRQISHNLGSVPGCFIVKETNYSGTNWRVYHRSLGNANEVYLNTTSASTATTSWASTTPTSTVFTVGSSGGAGPNDSGSDYVAYLFAHDAGGFGLSGEDNVISCGSFTTDGSGNATVSLGYEPQWVLAKMTDTADYWYLMDNMRGMPVGSATAAGLYPNSSDAENQNLQITLTPTGFNCDSDFRASTGSRTWIYIAIRRGPMKVPTSGTSVFSPVARAGTSATATVTAGFPVDMTIIQDRTQNSFGTPFDRLRGATNRLFTALTLAEASEPTSLTSFAVQTGFTLGTDLGFGAVNTSGDNYINWNFRRAPSFFDEVCYTPSAYTDLIYHNLGVAPEMIIAKNRGATATQWYIHHTGMGASEEIYFNANAKSAGSAWTRTSTYWNNSSALFPLGEAHVAYLFATCAGVSKVGSYTGTGALQTVNCGFTGGARFVLIKRTDSTGDWWTYDSARGITSGNDPYLYLNSTAAEVTGTNYVDTTSVGFQVTAAAPAGLNASGGTYIFLAIA